jgi:hypothetical protein
LTQKAVPRADMPWIKETNADAAQDLLAEHAGFFTVIVESNPFWLGTSQHRPRVYILGVRRSYMYERHWTDAHARTHLTRIYDSLHQGWPLEPLTSYLLPDSASLSCFSLLPGNASPSYFSYSPCCT